MRHAAPQVTLWRLKYGKGAKKEQLVINIEASVCGACAASQFIGPQIRCRPLRRTVDLLPFREVMRRGRTTDARLALANAGEFSGLSRRFLPIDRPLTHLRLGRPLQPASDRLRAH